MQGGCQLDRVAIAQDVHVERGWLRSEQMIVHGGDLDAALGQLLHDGIDLVGGEHEVAHDHRHAAVGAEREPAAQGQVGLISTPSKETCRSVRGSPTR